MIWKILSIFSLAVPVAMVALGLILWRCPPKGPNWLLGFRSRRARAGDDSWAFAQDLAGKIWFCLGLCLLIAALLVCHSLRDVDIEASLPTWLLLLVGQIVAMLVVIITVNIVLLCKFDRFGRRRVKRATTDTEDGYEVSTEEAEETETAGEDWEDYDEEAAPEDTGEDFEEDAVYDDDLPMEDGGF